jgi:sugar phosphate isomerase/epimerase
MFNPLGWTMDAFAEAGYSGVEVLFAQSLESRDPDRILGFAREAGLSVPVVHGPYMLFLRNVFGANYLDKTRRSIELAARIGAHTLVAHAPLRWERGAEQWARVQAADEAAEHGVRFAMENLYPVWGMHFSSVVVPEDLAGFRHVVFDTSHFAVTGTDLFAAWHALRDRVTHLHLSNNLGTGRDTHAPLETGVLPMRRFMAHVGRSGYDGTITLELDVRAHIDDRTRLVAFLRSQRELAQRWLAGEDAEDVEDVEAVPDEPTTPSDTASRRAEPIAGPGWDMG